jgi:hypothetical protein
MPDQWMLTTHEEGAASLGVAFDAASRDRTQHEIHQR